MTATDRPASTPGVRAASPPRFEVEVAWDVRIPARDGVQLSANVWRPVTDEPVPAILEMIPYGKDNWRRASDMAHGQWFAARGYALIRVDVRGTGSSYGIALDEYTADETRDGYDAVEWAAAQPWCDGNVGMWGISYGGFTAIQVAALRPPHLKAIIPVMATDDRYVDDVHYRGGCATVSELSQYAVSQVAMNAMPPEATYRGAAWRSEWLERLYATPPWLFTWLREQTDGPYWRQGSLAPDYDAITAAIFNVGGWQDSYVDPAFRMQARCPAPSHMLVGPWHHSWPQDAEPGPNLDGMHEFLRFFDRHLRREANGWDEEPPVVWFERDWSPPEAFPRVAAGRWRAAAAYPHPATMVRSWAFGERTLDDDDAADDDDEATGIDRFAHRATTGTRGALSWGSGGAPNGLARDLRRDEDAGPTYTSAILHEAVEVLGVPEVVVHIAVDAPIATLSVRLGDVAPDGSVALVSAGLLNLTHRRSHADPEPLLPGVIEEVRVPLRTAGYRWAPGHRIRIAISSSLWPVAWPSPFPATLEVHRGPATPSRLELPVVPPAGGTGDVAVPAFRLEPPDMPYLESPPLDGGRPATDDPPVWRIDEDVIAGTTTVHIHGGGDAITPDGRRLYTAETMRMTASDADPAHASMDADVVYRWQELEADLAGALTAIEIRAVSRQTSERIPRHLV